MSEKSKNARKETSPHIAHVNRVVKYEANDRAVVNEEEIDDDLEVVVGDEVDHQVKAAAPPPPEPVEELKKTELKSGKNKSRFYMDADETLSISQSSAVATLKADYVFPNEEKLSELSRAYCLNSLGYFSAVDAATKPNSGGKLPDPIDQEGRLELTNYCLRFMPSNQISDCFKTDREHQMFELGQQSLGFVIPLMHIMEVRGVGASSEKLKKLSTPSEVMVNVPKELYIKCKVT